MSELRDVVVRCPECTPIGGADPLTCTRCGTTGFVQACAACFVLPRDPMFAPCCSSVCLQAWEARQRLEALKARSAS